ncbi:MAG: hypothetical protein ACE5F1_12515 [Planctomycetota bacterium]
MHPRRVFLAAVLLGGLGACFVQRNESETTVPYAAKAERVPDFAALASGRTRAGEASSRRAASRILLERVTAGVPWPRGLAWVDGRLLVLARGRHRRAGGIDPRIPDQCGTLLIVDPDVAEPVVAGKPASDKVRRNAKLLAPPQGPPFQLYDGRDDPSSDTRLDRPYCTLIYDPGSRNLILCGYSGVDLPGARFRKNATDSIHRYDLRSKRWYAVEMHDASVVPPEKLGYVVPNQYYPHHDPLASPPPHGWLNGPDGGCVAGRFLYCVGKDNHSVVQYDLKEIDADPDAGPPESRLVLGPRVRVRHPGGEEEMELLGPSAAAVFGRYLYLGYRTSSVVVRLRIDAEGRILEPAVGELIAVFEPWDAERKRSANLIDIAFNGSGELFVSCAKEGRIWRVGRPDPERVFNGNDQGARPTSAAPYIDLRRYTGKKTGCGNILFDDRDRLYICVGNYDAGPTLAGAVYRATEESE